MQGLSPRLIHMLGLFALAAPPALAQGRAPPALPPFPLTRSLPAVTDWARHQTDLPVSRIVAVGPDSVFAAELVPPGRPGPVVRILVRQEAISPDFAKRLGGRSAAMTADIDCVGRRVFQRQVQLYVASNRQGAARQLGAAKDWQAIPPATYMERVMVAVCDPAWRPPSGATSSPILTAIIPAPPPLAPQPLAPPAPRPAPAGPPARAELGRFTSTEAALAAWGRVAGQAPGKRLRIEIGGSEFRAIVEGFASRAEAEGFCRTAGCVPIN